MFTGLVATIGRVAAISPRSGFSRIAIASDLPVAEMQDGESVAVDGVCLTVAGRSGERFEADAVAETLGRTTLGRLRVGRSVNLERALRLSDRLGGHLVQGHVDGVARVIGRTRRGGDERFRVRIDPGLRRFVAFKGSVALHGVSLTVAGLGADWLEVALVPQTLARTTLTGMAVGDVVNVEVDLVARYLDSLLGSSAGATEGGDRGNDLWTAVRNEDR